MPQNLRRRVYPLIASPDLTEEEIAVAFAMTSRRPEPFDEIAQQLTLQKASDFHEKWVLDYGHSSVAEHAVIHLAVENISRIACDVLEDNRLASYTEKSSRYQVMAPDHFHTPGEFTAEPSLRTQYRRTCNFLFRTYAELLKGTTDYLRSRPKPQDSVTDPYPGNPDRVAPDHCRAILPAGILTNVGITINARSLQHAVSKLLSHHLQEPSDLGHDIAMQANQVVPTLLKHAGYKTHIEERHLKTLNEHVIQSHHPIRGPHTPPTATLVDWDREAVFKVITAIMMSRQPISYTDAMDTVRHRMDWNERNRLIASALQYAEPHDPAPREFETTSYTFEYRMDYGALREFKRHRMQTYITQPLTVHHGYSVPPLIQDAGLSDVFQKAMEKAEKTFTAIHRQSPLLVQYTVTHAHNQVFMSRMNLRECYHLFKLRTSKLAHFAVREPVLEAMELAINTHPELFKYLKLRDYPDWWPFTIR